MNKQQATGTVLKARGGIERFIGRLTGNRRRQATGVAHQVEGNLRHGVGDVQDAVGHHEDGNAKT